MKKVFKYTLNVTAEQVLELPKGAELISAKEQFGNIVLYALVNPEVKIYDGYNILVLGTGYEVSEHIEDYTFLNTVKIMMGKFMFHIFYKKMEEKK